ncbi:hypothetical protein F2Q69_00011033 [Brassica cretica]|uniref:Replication factor A C-terminal domain-containing protein n=1 Tax=Brassica cretica TaxID=69181 RepID=A0A8S9R3T0_BRACR|nr:hypothetical protein F2Q69_00011033 [Brassica cretica]
MKLSGVSDSVKTNGKAAVPSRPVKPVAQPSVSSGDVNLIPSGLVKPVVQTGVSSGDAIPMKSKDVTAEANSSIKPNGKTGASSGLKLGVRGRASVSSVDKGKAIVSENVGKVITFKDVTFGPHEDEVRFRLIHFWEAWNVQTKVLIGIEMLLIDEEESVIQGFIPCGRIETYLRHMKTGATYRLNKFFGSKSKPIYRVAEPSVTISFSWNSVLSGLEDSSISFPVDRFRIHGHREFEAGSDLRGDLYDYIGHIKLVNGKVPGDGLLLDESEIAASRRVELHVQTHDDLVLKQYLWDKVAFEFREKFKASGGTARVILVTTLNPKQFGGILSVSSMASSQVFLDGDVQETLLYLSWLDSNLDVASRVNAEVVTKPEIATLGDLLSYMNHASAKFKASGGTARVILVTTLNPKRFGGVLSLSSMASSRVFLDGDVQETLLYLSWLDSNLDVASRVNTEVVTKPEIVTLGDLFSYMNHASAKVAWFECTATIDDVMNGSGWYYIGCGVCHTKATKGPTTLMCKKYGKSEIVGVAQYLSKLSVYDHSDQAVFVVLGDAGEELTGKKAAELVERYYEANDIVGEDHIVPVPQAIIDTIGQTRKFIVKVAWFECTATIDDVVNGYGWYYIGCGVCHTKATKGPTTLMCKKCGKSEIVGVAQYLSKLSVYDHSDQAVFVVLGDAGEELTGKKAAELVERYYEANDSVGEDHIGPVPQAIIDTIGQTQKFIVKVSNHNLTAKTQTLTVTKVLPLEAPDPKGNLGVNVGEEADSESEDHADESVKRGADGIGSEVFNKLGYDLFC